MTNQEQAQVRAIWQDVLDGKAEVDAAQTGPPSSCAARAADAAQYLADALDKLAALCPECDPTDPPE